jgi:hypothetical protein
MPIISRLSIAFVLSLIFCIPVLANLLHGLTGHYDDWVQRTNVADYAAGYRMIVVTPEGHDSWWAYWDRQVREVLKLAAEKMRLPAKARTSRA